ncbi:hypothetical protein ACOSQ3_003889 [Xanthoceras sorbifolium]
MSMDMERQLVTVKGTMDSEALTEYLKDTLKRPVEIVPPTKDDEDKESDDSGDDSNRYNARNYRLPSNSISQWKLYNQLLAEGRRGGAGPAEAQGDLGDRPRPHFQVGHHRPSYFQILYLA